MMDMDTEKCSFAMPGGLKIPFKAGHENNPGGFKDRCSVKAQLRLCYHHTYMSN